MKTRWVMAVLGACLVTGMAVSAASGSSRAPRRVRSYAEILRLLRGSQPHYGFGPRLVDGPVLMALADAAAGGETTPPVAHSETNVQVAGVDEADFVKSDGEYIYQISGSTLFVVKAYPDTEMAIAARVDFADRFSPQELFLEGDRLVVIGMGWDDIPRLTDPSNASRSLVARMWWWASRNFVQAIVYDISDRTNPTVIREVCVDGDYLSSRKIDDSIYLLARKYPNYCFASWGGPVGRGVKSPAPDTLVPAVSDAVAGTDWQTLPPARIFYFPEFTEPDYVVIASFRLAYPDQPVDAKAYLGAGETIYASRENLYVSAAANDRMLIRPMAVSAVRGDRPVGRLARTAQVESTRLYRFALADGRATLAATGSVPGTVLNQFSMDESSGTLRIATTFHRWWSQDGQDSNNLYVLDHGLNQVGRLEGIAPGERIYATRFLGDRCYMVTFKNTDPLFVIDLATPTRPTILGELKIPGYSNYLHPYDANHIIGFGKDAVVVGEDGSGDEVWATGLAFYQGMKVALFDVTDVANPVEMYAVHIGDRGTDSELLRDHKALLFDRERQLLAFPLTLCEIPDTGEAPPPWQYGTPVFEGAYVYSLTLEKGFEFRGGITHVAEDGDPLYAWDRMVRRLLYIDTNLYSVSNWGIKSNDLSTLVERRVLEFPAAAVVTDPALGNEIMIDGEVVP